MVKSKDAQDLWSDFLQPIVFAYNTSINDTTGYSPFFVAYGRHPITWSDIVHQLPSRLTFATESFADQLTAALQTTIMDVGNQIARKTATYKSGYDYQNKVYTKDISTGDLVLLRDDTNRPKFTHQWKGPFVVTSINRSFVKNDFSPSATSNVASMPTANRQARGRASIKEWRCRDEARCNNTASCYPEAESN
ncbi:hypothetical protein Y032_0205g1915 [Ancylostoma ceylanicum]|uniref:Integrase catalytic domain-containing protein n=1 Tax=Ancylostoma ceylanicum TaxID=53326 RepID=A0A016SMC2_9BILA|nr:hypothetical protein Y032_0205g1915 [Ancylostoma ceylanicum]